MLCMKRMLCILRWTTFLISFSPAKGVLEWPSNTTGHTVLSNAMRGREGQVVECLVKTFNDPFTLSSLMGAGDNFHAPLVSKALNLGNHSVGAGGNFHGPLVSKALNSGNNSVGAGDNFYGHLVSKARACQSVGTGSDYHFTKLWRSFQARVETRADSEVSTDSEDSKVWAMLHLKTMHIMEVEAKAREPVIKQILARAKRRENLIDSFSRAIDRNEKLVRDLELEIESLEICDEARPFIAEDDWAYERAFVKFLSLCLVSLFCHFIGVDAFIIKHSKTPQAAQAARDIAAGLLIVAFVTK